MEGDLTASYEQVHREYRRYRKRLTLSLILLYASMLVLTADLVFFPAGLLVKASLVPFTTLAIIGFSGIIISLFLPPRISGPNTEKRLFMRTYRVLSSLTRYLMDSSKIDERGLAKKRMRRLIERVDRLWSLDSMLEENALAPIPVFKKILKNKILYCIEEGSVDDLRKASSFLGRFARFLLEERPQVSEVEEMNQSATSITIARPADHGNWLVQFSRWVLEPERVGIILPLGFALASGPAYFVASTVGGVPALDAFGPATTVTMGFTTAYLTYYFTQVRPSRKKGKSQG